MGQDIYDNLNLLLMTVQQAKLDYTNGRSNLVKVDLRIAEQHLAAIKKKQALHDILLKERM